MLISTPLDRLTLRGMKEAKNKPHPWETEWTLFGPVKQSAAVFLGELADYPLELDGATRIPVKAVVSGEKLSAIKAVSKGGLLDFRQIFKYSRGNPIAYAMTVIESDAPGICPVFFGADWITLWWLNGKFVFETMFGNGLTPALDNHSFPLHLKPGKNILVIRVVSGMDGWLIHLGCDQEEK